MQNTQNPVRQEIRDEFASASIDRLRETLATCERLGLTQQAKQAKSELNRRVRAANKQARRNEAARQAFGL